jgi:membrane-associated phospholipid phosphatase
VDEISGPGGLMGPAEHRGVTQDRRPLVPHPRLTLLVAIGSSVVVALLAALVWHTLRPDPVDAEMMRWQEGVTVRGNGIATVVATSVAPLAVLVVLAGAALAWRVKRWDAVVLALVATPGAYVVESLLKEVVHRQREGGADLLYPSGHVAVAAAAVGTVVLVAGVVGASPRTRTCVAWLAGCLVIAVAAARLVQTVHFATDVVGGAALGIAVTCWAALAISKGVRHVPIGGGLIIARMCRAGSCCRRR